MKFMRSILLIFIVIISIPSQGQQFFEDNVNDQTTGTSDAPINGFVGFGILAGICYGIRQLKK